MRSNRILRLGIIGAGSVARRHMPALRRAGQFQLAAVCDIDEAAARKFAVDAAVYTDAHRLLHDAAIDAVDICTPHDRHADLAVAAAQAGKHILLEKPMACSIDDCRRIVAAAEAAGVTLMIAQEQRFHRDHQAVRSSIESGEFGQICRVRIEALLNMPGLAPPNHWVYDGRRAGGGVVISLAQHSIDLARFLLGNVRRIPCARCTFDNAPFHDGAEDNATATLEFDSGVTGELFASFTSAASARIHSLAITTAVGSVHRVPLVGGPAASDALTGVFLHFSECCRTGREPISGGRDAMETMRTVFAIYHSARSGGSANVRSL